MPSAAPETGGFQEKIAGCDVFRELSALVTQRERCSAGCRAQHQRAELPKKKWQDAMFFVNSAHWSRSMNAARQDAERSTSGRSPPRKNRRMRCFS
jgi:hypothetical protein